MSIQTAPGTTFEAYSPELASGLTGTIGVRIRDGAGADFLARTTTGITADVTVGTTSVYRRTLTAPTTLGQYWIVWDDGTSVTTPEELVVTHNAPTAVGGTLYITPTALKATLEIDGSYADDDIQLACEAASRAIDGYMGTRFYQTTETRYYTASAYADYLDINDLVNLTSVTLDTDGNGSYDTTWTEGTDFVLDPANAALEGRPTRRIFLLSQAGRAFPTYNRAVKVVGDFGWSSPPALVQQAAKILASRLLKRARETPYGILTVVADTATAARLGRIDPDVAFLLDQLPAGSSRLLV